MVPHEHATNIGQFLGDGRGMAAAEVHPRFAPATRLDRAAWHRPLVSVVVTHHDYSGHVRDALLSLLDQTHERWECVIVDDASDDGHRMALERIVYELGSPKIRVIWLEDNVGQIPAFYAGLDEARGEFVCLLDPDDRYAESFLEQALAAHMNGAVYAPILCTDQHLMKDGEVLTGTYARSNMRFIEDGTVPDAVPRQLRFCPAGAKGWHWSSTSAMMFRRAALELMRPHRELAYMGSADSYLAQGAHALGGSLYLNQPLIYRTTHAGNAWLTEGIFASSQDRRRPGGQENAPLCLLDVIEAIKANGGAQHLPQQRKARKSLPRRLARSIRKRWSRLMGRAC